MMAQTALAAKTKETSAQPNKAVEVLKWVCDVCKKARFADFDEACRHEKFCGKKKETTLKPPSPTDEPPSHPSRDSKRSSSRANAKALKACNRKEATQTAPPKKSGSHYNVISLDSSSSDDEKSSKHNRGKRSSSRLASRGDGNLQRKPPPTSGENTRNHIESKSNAVASIFHKAARGSSKLPPSRAAKPKLDVISAPLAGIFGKGGTSNTMKATEAAALLAEHRSAEFAAKRRADAERDRQRQRKRNEARQRLNQSEPSRADAPSQTLQSKKKLSAAAPRFPIPSHVLGPTTATPSKTEVERKDDCLADKHMLAVAKQGFCKTAKHPSGDTPVATDCCQRLLLEKNHKLHGSPQATDILYEAMASLLIPPNKRSSDRDDRMWCDKYSMQHLPEDVCGQSNREAAAKLLDFVKEWKQQRKQVLVRMAEKRESHKTKKRRKILDDLWCDSEEEDDSLVNVCLLTGPSGSGKTSLVHAVAKQTGCVVLEINSTERRGGQALRHSIEEATQSHSSLTMLKQSNQLNDATIETDEESVEQGSSVAMILIDEIDILFENDGDSGFWPALSCLTKKAKCPIFATANKTPDALLGSKIRFAHVTTSLPTPSECAAKLWQIVKMEGFSWRKDIFSGGDAVKEQLSWIAQLCRCDLRRVILELQLFSYSNGSPSRLMSTLSSKTEIQASSAVPTKECASTWPCPVISDIEPASVPSDRYSLLTIRGRNFCNVPIFRGTGAGEESDSTLDQAWEIFIGDQACPAMRVIDDTTILAVCPPCLLPYDVNESGLFKTTLKECLSCRYAPVSIRYRVRNGTISTSDSSPTITLFDDYAISALIPNRNIQYTFPPMQSGHGNISSQPDRSLLPTKDETVFCRNGSSGENCGPAVHCTELGDPRKSSGVAGDTEKPMGQTGSSHSMSFNMNDTKISKPRLKELEGSDCVAEKLLKQGITEWTASRENKASSLEEKAISSKLERICHERDCQIYAWNERVGYASDVAVIEDSLADGGIPHLSGAVRGFGYDLVDSVDGSALETSTFVNPKKCRNPNATPLSCERLFSLGWNDNCFFYGNCDMYLTSPVTKRDKRLLMRNGAFSRGMCFSEYDGVSSPPNPEVSEESDLPMESSFTNSADEAESMNISNSEEDMFLQRYVPLPLFSLPSLLREGFGISRTYDSKHSDAELAYVLELKKEQTASLLIKNLSSLFMDDAKALMFCRGLTREMDSSVTLLDEVVDSRLFLDYLPAVRFIAVNELKADDAFQRMLQVNPEACSGVRSGRRSTRRSRQLGRKNYLEGLIGTAKVGDSEYAKHLSREFANASLCFSGT